MKISIIIPCFNQGKYLAETLDSVIMQTFTDWECIVINDGSTDNTDYVVGVYVKIDRRIKYIYQKNQGVCIARNNAIRKASGEYILCLDADDKISEKYVELAAMELDSDSNITLVTCNYQYFGKLHRKIILEPYAIEKLMGHNLFINCSMFRKIDFERVNGFNLNMKLGLEDWDFWLSILKNGGKVKYLDGFHFFYRIKKSETSRNSSVALENYDSLRKQIWINHIDLYSSIYMPAQNTLEYIQVISSKEYRIGYILLKPIRIIAKLFYGV